MRASSAAAIALLLSGCGKDGGPLTGPVAPASDLPAGTELTVVSGETSEALPAVRLMVAGREYHSDAQGHVRLEVGVVSGTPMDVVGSAYLDRQTLARSAAETRFTLWPRRSPTGLDEDFTRRIIYTSGAEGAIEGDQALERIVARRAALLLPAELKGDSEVLATLNEGAARMSEVTQGRVRYELADRAPEDAVPVELAVGPGEEFFSRNSQAVAFAQLSINTRNEIIRTRIVFRDVRYARRRNVAHHELGHTLGLGHSPFTGDLMHCCSPVPDELTARERLAVQLAYQRRAGNRFPDNDRDSRSQSLGGTRVLICGAQR